jgi:predicted dithiol-disulfide oxidoreductase (DUF899 family)
MGWCFKWMSSYGSDFNYDFHVPFRPKEIETDEVTNNYEIRNVSIDKLSRRSVLYKDNDGDVFYTYSSYGRDGDLMLGFSIHNLMPKGCKETGPNHNLTDWVRHHGRYDDGGVVYPTGRCIPAGVLAENGS